MTDITKNITNSGLEQIRFKQNSMIYKVHEKPKFAYYIYTGEVEIISKNDYVIGTLKEGELFQKLSVDHRRSVYAVTLDGNAFSVDEPRTHVLKIQEQEGEKKICHKLIHLIDNYKTSQFIVFREVIYEMFIYQLNVYQCIWYVLSHYISNKKLNKENIEYITNNLYTILKFYNNNYRPIYHIETLVYMLCNIIHEL